MARKLSRRSKQRVERNMALIENINVLINSISEDAITDLVRRDAIGIGHDGFPADSMPEHSGGGFSGSSTEAAALYGLASDSSTAPDDWARAARRRSGADVVRKQLAAIENNLKTAQKALNAAVFEITNINKKTEEVRGRQASEPCKICGIDAAQKSGWCLKDYKEWEAAGRPDKTLYAMWKRGDTNSEGRILVSEPPQGKKT